MLTISRLANLNRARKIAQAFARHGLFWMVDQFGLADGSLVRPPEKSERKAAHFGRRLSLALNELGPTFVKLGQVLSTREDLFSAPTLAELSQLQDNVAPVSFAAIRAEVERSLGHPLEVHFAHVEEVPLAAGSIAQVHRARTHGGADVVIKVRRPNIRKSVEEDISLLRGLAELAASRVPSIAQYEPAAFVDEFGDGLRAELDFRRELDALRRVRDLLDGPVTAPEPIDALCSDAVITMSFVAGKKVSTLESEEAKRNAKVIVAAFATQYLRGDLFHADPHSGNILTQEDGRLVLIDMGAVGELDNAMRTALLRMATSASRRDGEALAIALLEAMNVPVDLDQSAYRRDVGALLDELLSAPLGTINASEVMSRAFGLMRTHRIRMRPQYFLLMRSAIIIEGVLRKLDPDIDPVGATRAFLLRSWLNPKWTPVVTRIVVGGFVSRIIDDARALARASIRRVRPIVQRWQNRIARLRLRS